MTPTARPLIVPEGMTAEEVLVQEWRAGRYETAGPIVAAGPMRTPAFVPAPRSVPTMPAMPQMLPAEPEEAAVTAAALKAMMGTDYRDDARTKAQGAAVRSVTAGALLLMTATMFWGALWLLADVGAEWLPVAWLSALVLTVACLLTSKRAGHKYSAAGIEHAKIDAATQMHYDRLEARKEMHAAATEAWERVMLKGLDRWQGSGE